MPSKDRVVKEWDVAAESWVDFVRKGKDYYRDEMNNPAAFRLIGNVKSKVILDLACGEGYNTRLLARKGARVVGVDLSESLIKHARDEESTSRLGIEYYISDAADLSRFQARHFDVVTCFMALMDIENYEGTISQVSRILKDGGRFVFSITHPCFEMIIVNGNRVSTSTRYFGDAEDHVDWNMERLLKPFKTTSFHRTLTDYSRVLCKNNLLIKRLVEPSPTKKGLKNYPPLRQVLLTPHALIFECVRTNLKSARTVTLKDK